LTFPFHWLGTQLDALSLSTHTLQHKSRRPAGLRNCFGCLQQHHSMPKEESNSLQELLGAVARSQAMSCSNRTALRNGLCSCTLANVPTSQACAQLLNTLPLTSSSRRWKLLGTREDVAAPRVLRLPAAEAGVLRLRVLRPTSTSSVHMRRMRESAEVSTCSKQTLQPQHSNWAQSNCTRCAGHLPAQAKGQAECLPKPAGHDLRYACMPLVRCMCDGDAPSSSESPMTNSSSSPSARPKGSGASSALSFSRASKRDCTACNRVRPQWTLMALKCRVLNGLLRRGRMWENTGSSCCLLLVPCAGTHAVSASAWGSAVPDKHAWSAPKLQLPQPDLYAESMCC
jgi:hypothetical protein